MNTSAGTPEKLSVLARRMKVEVETALVTQTPAQVQAQFPVWQKMFPGLFRVLINGTCTPDKFDFMMEQLERVERGATSQHNASVAVGGMLVETVVKPQLKSGSAGGGGK